MKTPWRDVERKLVLGSRYLTAIAVVGTLAGSVLMFFLGSIEIVSAYGYVISGTDGDNASISPSAAAVIAIIEALDRFLIALVLLYFAYGVYSLFIHPEPGPKEAEEEFALPAWLRVKQIGQLKQVVAEVIVVILFVLFLRVALGVFQNAEIDLSWRQMGTLVLLPVCAVLLALALRLVELHPKPPRNHRPSPAQPEEE